MNPYLDRANAHLAQLEQQRPSPNSKLLDALGSALAAYAHTPDLTATFVHLLPELLEIARSPFGFLAEIAYSGATPYLKSHAVVDIYKPNFTHRDIVSNLSFWNLDTLNGAIMTSRAPVVSNDPANDPRSGGVPSGHMTLQAFLGMPFLVDDQLLGALAIANKPGGYTDADVELFGDLAEIGGLLIAADRS